jgi:membrane protein YqaA with SNARE-associated domain
LSPSEAGKQKRNWVSYVISSIGVLLTVLLIAALVVYWKEIPNIGAYGYLGEFLVSILGGITIIPAPSLIVTFTLGHALNPVFIGLVSGFGEAIGGITTYLTGAGVETMWSRIRSREQALESVQSRFWMKGETFYNRLVDWVGGRGGSWVVFIVSAMIISPFYFAGIAAGSLRMGLLRFFLLSWAGKTIRGLIIAFAGYGGLYFLLKWIGA